MTIYRIRPYAGARLDANIELDDRAVILHSRGGATKGRPPRNTEYQAALAFIIERLFRDHQWIRRILIDSAQARTIAPNPADRVLMEQSEVERIGDPAAIVRVIRQRARDFRQPEGAAGGNSTKQLRIETGWGHSFLRAGLNLRIQAAGYDRDPSTGHLRLTNDQQRRVTSAEIKAAVEQLLAGHDMPNFGDSRDYDLITEKGDRLAPKKAFGRALEIAGVVEEANPYHFNAGWTQPCFPMLEAAGYTIIAKSAAVAEADRRRRRAKANARKVDAAAATVGVDAEEHSWIEGDRRMATHLKVERRRSVQARAAKRAAIRAANNGRLACEHCTTDWYSVYPVAIAEAVFDVHHIIPLKDVNETCDTTLDDLLCLCANCHRAEHRRMAIG